MDKIRIYKHTDDSDNTYYELAWMTDYNTDTETKHFKIFNNINQVENFLTKTL